ncbi:VanZ family protein [Chitinivorax tropicus]|uniref:VanZ family protein n=1 Tax=Chitinivorax tropicus TaxID=714531 RepID=A0A840MTZ0_9PROT|nr:VanZ family protein [Chitinivorax tropicus]MBB5020262.1 VanZ family protein [Chitinivorax tropicus]
MPWQTPIALLAREAPRSYLSRHVSWIYALIILLISLYPFSSWRWPVSPLWAFLSYPTPYYHSHVDDALNVLAYIPLGGALFSLLRSRLAAFWAFLLAIILGACLSFLVESLQMFLPTRVPSNLDIYHNTLGTIIGAWMAWGIGSRTIMRRFNLLRHHWFVEGGWADFGLVLLLSWFLTQLDPAIPLFGVVFRPVGLPQPFQSPLADPSLFLQLLEAGDAMLNLLIIGLLVSLLVQHRRFWPIIMLSIIAVALVIKLAMAGMLLKPFALFQWLNWRTVSGLLAAMVLLPILLKLVLVPRALTCALAVLTSLAVDWLWPLKASAGAALALFRKPNVQLTNFNGMSHVMADLWPWLLLVFLAGFVWHYSRHHHPRWL